MTELKNRNKELQDRVTATEQTVRSQSEKLKRCQNALAAAGIASPPLSPIRGSRSQPDLSEYSKTLAAYNPNNSQPNTGNKKPKNLRSKFCIAVLRPQSFFIKRDNRCVHSDIN